MEKPGNWRDLTFSGIPALRSARLKQISSQPHHTTRPEISGSEDPGAEPPFNQINEDQMFFTLNEGAQERI
jgi:hypothetical protein